MPKPLLGPHRSWGAILDDREREAGLAEREDLVVDAGGDRAGKLTVDLVRRADREAPRRERDARFLEKLGGEHDARGGDAPPE